MLWAPWLQDSKGLTALQLAAKHRHMETVAKLLDSAGTKEEKGYTALHLAVQAGNSDLVRQLLALPACDPSAKDVDGLTALHWAASKGEPRPPPPLPPPYPCPNGTCISLSL